MKRIKLTRGKFALVSDIDYTYLNQWKWCYHNEGYAVRTNKGILMHRLILERKLHNSNFKEVDHTDRDRLNNQRRNLRPATRKQNTWNVSKRINTRSRYKGVCWHEHGLFGKWRVRIQINGHSKHLGYYTDLSTAVKIYNEAAKKYFGKFARLNLI